jgi:hypothetical protein
MCNITKVKSFGQNVSDEEENMKGWNIINKKIHH